MLYREFLGNLSDEDFAQVIIEDMVFNMACVENLVGENNLCKYNYTNCHKCVLALLKSDIEKLDLLKRDDMQD